MKLKKFASIGALIALLVSAAFIAGCKQDANSGGGNAATNPFIGTWETSTGLNRLVFNATTVTNYYRTSASGDWQFGASAPYTFSATRQPLKELAVRLIHLPFPEIHWLYRTGEYFTKITRSAA